MEKYLKDKRAHAKAWHYRQNRAVFQRESPQNNFRRLGRVDNSWVNLRRLGNQLAVKF